MSNIECNSIHAAVSEIRFRVFDSQVDVDKSIASMNEKYDGFFVANINDLGVARIEGLRTRLTFTMIRKVGRVLLKYGAVKVEWRHKDTFHSVDLLKKKL